MLKIIKHCADSNSHTVTGSLLGMSSPSSSILEITSSFPFPSANNDRLAPNLDADGNPIIIARGGAEVVMQAVIDEDGNVIDPTKEGEGELEKEKQQQGE